MDMGSANPHNPGFRLANLENFSGSAGGSRGNAEKLALYIKI
jgi:hypothetical protein